MRRRMRESPRRSSPTAAGRRHRASAPRPGATTASRARSRTAGFLPQRGRRSCHAGGEARSFRWATSPRRRSRGASSPFRESPAAVAPPRAVRSRPGRRERWRRPRARREPSLRGRSTSPGGAGTSASGTARRRWRLPESAAHPARARIHWSAVCQVMISQRPSGAHSSSRTTPVTLLSRRPPRM